MSDGYLWLKVLHLLSATLLFGTGLGTAFHMYATHLRGNVTEIAAASRNTIVADWLFTVPSGVVQPATGLAMAWLAGFDLLESWLAASYALFLLAAGCWFRVAVLQYRIRGLALHALQHSTSLPPAYYRAMREWFWLGWPAFLSLVIVFALMVMRPGLW